MPEYKDFKIIVSPNGTDEYSVRAEKTEYTGEGVSSFKKTDILSFGAGQADLTAEVEKLNRKMKIIFVPPAAGSAADYSKVFNSNAAKAFGKKLSKVVFSGAVRDRFIAFKTRCGDKANIRIRIDLSEIPELAGLPWEYLCRPDNDNFVCLDNEMTLVRYLQTAFPTRPLKVNSSLKILVAASMPQNAVQLDTTGEIEKIKDGIARLKDSINKISVEVLDRVTLNALKEKLEEAQRNNAPFHVLHFIGHGAFDETTKQGKLLFEDEAGGISDCSDEAFARLLEPFNSDLKLVVLNSCKGATISTTDSYSSVATKIMQTAGIPAVIAMQFSITDPAAITFAEQFYAELASGTYLEPAVGSARNKVATKNKVQDEWATPVLYLRADDGHLFDIRIPNPPQRLITSKHYEKVTKLLSDYNLVIFIGLNANLASRPYYDSWLPGKSLPSVAEICSYLNKDLDVSPPVNSLAWLAKKVQFKKVESISEKFETIFDITGNISELYKFLADLTQSLANKFSADRAAKIAASVMDNPNLFPWDCPIIFVTTTYDKSFENAFNEENKVANYNVLCYAKTDRGLFFNLRQYRNGVEISREFLNDARGYLLDNTYPIILKLPGEFADGSTYAITEDDFFTFNSKEIHDLLPPQLLTKIANSPHLYLGCDFQDWTIRMMWERLCYNRDVEKNEKSYALIFDESNDPNAKFWEEKDIPHPPADLDDYLAGLQQLVLPQI